MLEEALSEFCNSEVEIVEKVKYSLSMAVSLLPEFSANDNNFKAYGL